MADYFKMEDAVIKSNILDNKADLNGEFHMMIEKCSFDIEILIYAMGKNPGYMKACIPIGVSTPIGIQRHLLDQLADKYCVTWRDFLYAQRDGNGLMGFKKGLVAYLYKRYILSETHSPSLSSSSSSYSKINTDEHVSSSSMVFSWQKDFINSAMTSNDFKKYLEINWDSWINPVLEYLMKLVYPGIVDKSALIDKIMSDRDIQPFIRYALNKSKDHRLHTIIRIPSYSDEELFEAYRRIINNTSLHLLLKMTIDGTKTLFFHNHATFFNYLRNLPYDKKTKEMTDNIAKVTLLSQIDLLFREIKDDQAIYIVGVQNDIVLKFLSSNPRLHTGLPKTESELKELLYPVIEDTQMMEPICETNTSDLLSLIKDALQNDTIAQTFFNQLKEEGIVSVDDLTDYIRAFGLPDLCTHFKLSRIHATN